jgi:hypothetical protein
MRRLTGGTSTEGRLRFGEGVIKNFGIVACEGSSLLLRIGIGGVVAEGGGKGFMEGAETGGAD